MKHSPTENKALAAARGIEPMTPEEWAVIRETPRERRSIEQRHALLRDTLKAAAGAFEDRERTNDLYRHYLKQGDRSEARWHAPSPLQDSTDTLRRRLTDAWKALQDFERMPLAPNVGAESKRWRKSTRFWQVMDAQKAIEKNGGKVRYRQRKTRKDLIYERVIAPHNPRPDAAPRGPQQLALSL